VERTQQKRPDLLKEESCLEDRVALKRTEV
jgi:hypothetical protein